MTILKLILIALFSLSAFAQREVHSVVTLDDLAKIKPSVVQPLVLVTAPGGSSTTLFRWDPLSGTSTSTVTPLTIIAYPYDAAFGRWVYVPGCGCNWDLPCDGPVSSTNVVSHAISTPGSSSLFVARFDSTKGVLSKIRIISTMTVRSTPRMENLTASIVTLVGGSSATLNASVGGISLGANSAQVTITNTVTAFDGGIDYGGVTGNFGSGFSAPPMAALGTNSSTMNPWDTGFSAFIGSGYATLSALSVGSDIAFGTTGETPPTDISFLNTTEVGFDIKVIYDYCAWKSVAAGIVWNDVNSNGIPDPGEPVYAGVTVTLLDSGGFPVTTAITDSRGKYRFDIYVDPGVDATLYSIGATQPDATSQIFDLDDGVNPTPASLNLASFYVSYRSAIMNINFGYLGL